jgi:hypothetical protein
MRDAGKMRRMSEPTLPPSPLPVPIETMDGISSAPQFLEYMLAAYAVVLVAMLWLVLSGYRERLRLKRLSQMQGKR